MHPLVLAPEGHRGARALQPQLQSAAHASVRAEWMLTPEDHGELGMGETHMGCTIEEAFVPHEERGDDVYVLAELLNSTQSAVRAHVHVTN